MLLLCAWPYCLFGWYSISHSPIVSSIKQKYNIEIVKRGSKRNYITCKQNGRGSSIKQQHSFMLLPFWKEDGVRLGKNEGICFRAPWKCGVMERAKPLRGSGNPLKSVQRPLPWVLLRTTRFPLLSGWTQSLRSGRERRDGEITIKGFAADRVADESPPSFWTECLA